MKKNLPVTNVERKFADDIHIVSTTDLKGIITACNQDFIEISGYSEDELIGKNHNILRHPDMPPAAFENLWQDLKQGKPWIGIVKNRCKNGDYYWVDAYITPIRENGQVTGYTSVRVKPEAEKVKRAEALYQQINAGSSLLARLQSVFSPGLQGKIFIGFVLAMLPLVAVLSRQTSLFTWLPVVLISLILGGFAAKLLARPWQIEARKASDSFSNTVAQHVFTGRRDELGQLKMLNIALDERLRTVIWSIDSAAGRLDHFARQTTDLLQQTQQGVNQQRREIEQVAAAMNQMAASVQAVSTNTSESASSSSEAERLASSGALIATESITSIMNMVSDAELAANVIRQLAEKTENIGSVLDVIRSIAEQTNLLALNAAIEAARAGEQGRGFAVVADEVRTLASRTHQSTEEIQQMIENLQVESQRAVDVMLKAQSSAEKNMDAVESMAENLAEISGAAQIASSMSGQIASAVVEQTAVTEEIHRNLGSINQLAEQTVASFSQTSQDARHLINEAENLRGVIRNFSTK